MEDQEVAQPQYAIDLHWYQAKGLSLDQLVSTCLCPQCQERYRLESGFDPWAAIAECCGNDPSFITPFTPTAEALFRLFLAEGNQPMTPAQLEEELKARLGYSRGYRDTSAATIQRLLENTTSYGFRRFD